MRKMKKFFKIVFGSLYRFGKWVGRREEEGERKNK